MIFETRIIAAVFCLLVERFCNAVSLKNQNDSLSNTNLTLTIIAGPHKTGSTSMEEIINKLKKSLTADGILLCDGFSGRFRNLKSGANLAMELQHSYISIDNFKTLYGCLTEARYKDVIIVSEEFDKIRAGPSMDFFASMIPRVRVALSRRNFNDWLVSLYHQIGRNLSFNLWLSKELGKGAHSLMLNPFFVSRQFQDNGIPVVMYNFMDFNSLICKILRARLACKTISQGSFIIPHKNNQASLHPEMECASHDVIDKLREMTTKILVPSGQNFTSITCAEESC